MMNSKAKLPLLQNAVAYIVTRQRMVGTVADVYAKTGRFDRIIIAWPYVSEYFKPSVP